MWKWGAPEFLNLKEVEQKGKRHKSLTKIKSKLTQNRETEVKSSKIIAKKLKK